MPSCDLLRPCPLKYLYLWLCPIINNIDKIWSFLQLWNLTNVLTTKGEKRGKKASHFAQNVRELEGSSFVSQSMFHAVDENTDECAYSINEHITDFPGSPRNKELVHFIGNGIQHANKQS